MLLWAVPSGLSAQETSGVATANQGATSPTLTATIKRDQIQSELTGVEGSAFSEEQKTRAKDSYQQALEQLNQAERWSSATAVSEAAVRNAPLMLQETSQALVLEPQEATINTTATSLADLQGQMQEAVRQLEAARQQAQALNEDIQRRADRRVEIPRLVANAKQRLEDVQQEEVGTALPSESSVEAQARVALASSRRAAISNELAAYEAEIRSYDATNELLSLQQDYAAQEIARLEKLTDLWQEKVSSSRKAEAGEAARKAREEQATAQTAHSVIQKLSEENAVLAAARTGPHGLSASIEKSDARLQEVNEALETVRQQERGIQSRVNAVGLSDAVGILLRKQREELRALLTRYNAAKLSRQEIASTHLEILELEDERARLRDLAPLVASATEAIVTTSETLTRDEATSAVRPLLERKRELVRALIQDYNSYFSRLIEIDTNTQLLQDEATELAAYIDERILWIPTGRALPVAPRSGIGDTLAWMFSPTNWLETGRALLVDMRRQPWIYGLTIFALAVLTLSRRRIRAALERDCAQAARHVSISFVSIIRSFIETLLLVMPIPFAIWFLGWRLEESEADGFVRAAGNAATGSAWVFATVELVRVTCIGNGLAALCWRWTPSALKTIRRNLGWFLAAAFVLKGLTEFAAMRGNATREEIVARVIFILAMIICSLFAHRLLHPSRNVLGGTIARDSTSAVYKMRYIWYWLGVGLPLLLGAGSFLGYHYTATQLGERLLATTWFLLGLVVLHELAVQWLVVSRRRLAIEELERQRAAVIEAGTSEEGPTVIEAASIDITTATKQANRFLRALIVFAFIAGIWIIWVDVLPALGILRNYELWSREVQTSEHIVSPEGVETRSVIDQVVPVTLADLLFAVIALMMTVMAARNLPGLLEISVLQKLKLSSGGRYAIATLSRYAITIVGSIIALRVIGVGWNNVQWMAAAITVGLGFGLQEIFANFVSGLILLFERPIRVGDIVMVNGIMGKVERIQIRATTIRDMDHKELIIPNKQFITDQVINYTLSDTVMRLQMEIHVAYGSDYDRAREILLRLCRNHPLTLNDPQPLAAIMQFCDSSVKFLVLVHMPNMDNTMSIRHELLVSIQKEFAEAGIAIPLPQRDVRIHSAAPASS